MKQNCVKYPIVRQSQATHGACNYPRHNSKVKFFLLQELLLPVFKNLSVIEIQVSRKGRGIGMAQQLFTSRVGGSKLNAAARKLLIFMTFTKNHLFSMIYHLQILELISQKWNLSIVLRIFSDFKMLGSKHKVLKGRFFVL